MAYKRRRTGFNSWRDVAAGLSSIYSSRNSGGRSRSTRVAMRAGGSMTRTRTRRRTPLSGLGVTTQYDAKRIYRKKRMPLRRRRRWKRFVNRVHAVAEKDMGSRTVVFNSQISQVITNPATSGCTTISLFGARGTTGLHDDLFAIGGLENTGNPTAAAGINVNQSTKLMFQSGVLDLTIRNASYQLVGASLVPTLVGAAKMELDVYEISVRNQAADSSGAGGYINLGLLFQNGNTDTLNIGGAGTGIDIEARGCTPFDIPQALSRWGMKIYKKTKYFIPNGDTITYQVRDPRRYVTDIDKMLTLSGCNMPKKTRFLFLVYQLVPGLTLGTTENSYQARIDMGITRKYMYKVEGANEDRDRYITAAFTVSNPS